MAIFGALLAGVLIICGGLYFIGMCHIFLGIGHESTNSLAGMSLTPAQKTLLINQHELLEKAVVSTRMLERQCRDNKWFETFEKQRQNARWN